MDFDLVVIGAGATGLGAARAGAQAGRRVALIEAGRPGGDCTHYGCVPSKTLLEIARRVAAVRGGSDAGITATVEVDYAAVMKRVQAVIEDIEQDESPALLARQGIDLVRGTARFVAPHTVAVEPSKYAADAAPKRVTGAKFVLATGGAAAVPPIPGLREAPYLDNRSIFALTEAPGHLLVLGGGPIGLELAQALCRLGSRVTLVEMAPRLAAREEPEASRVVTEVLEREGVDVRVGTTATAVRHAAGSVTVELGDAGEVTGTHLLVALGRTPATASLDLALAGVETDGRGRVTTDAYLRTTNPDVFAAGDCTSLLQFTHVGDEQGRLAAANAFASNRLPVIGQKAWDDRVVPWVTFTEPEIGRVGMTEAEAFAAYGEKARVAYVPMAALDRPRTAGATDGFVKLIAAPGPVVSRFGVARPVLLKLVGMTAVAEVGGELVAEGALAMRAGVLVARLAQTIHAYPTWSVATRIAAASFFGSYGGRSARPARGDRG